MSDHCGICGIVTRGGACGDIDSRRERDHEVARCPDADPDVRKFARERIKRDLGWDD